MKRFSKILLSVFTVALVIFMVTSCATQPAPEVVEEAPVEEPVVEVVVEEPAAEEAEAEEVAEVEEEAPVEEAEVVVEAEEEEVEEAFTFRIVGTDGLLGLAAATYQGGLGLDEVSAIVNIAEAGAPTLVLDAGTSAVAVPDLGLTLEDGEALAKVIAAIGYDAMTPGVADLQFGAELVNMLGAASGMSVVSANAAEFADTAIVEVGGVKVGIFGLTTPLANNVGVAVSPVIGDMLAAAEAAVVELKAAGADFVVALTNMGYEQAMISSADLDWAAEYMSGYVDLIIDGMGSVPYSEIRGTTMYVQLGGYAGALEVTVQGDKVVAVEQLLITEEMIAEAEADAEVSALLAAEGARLAELVAEAAVEEAVEEAEEPVVEEAEVVVEEEVAEAVTFRIVGTDGLLGLAAATYQGGLGLDEVSAIVNIAEAGAPTLVLDAGTSAVAVPDLGLTLEDGEALAKVIAAIGYDAMTPGVADLQFGAELVNMLGAASGMSVVSANAAEFADTAIVEVGGVKVGIFGLTTPLANNVGVAVSPVIGDMLAAAEAAVVELKAAGADFVVALTNMGYEQAMISSADLDWAAEYMSGYVDLIIDGMGSVPYSEIRGTTMYVQLGGYAGALEVTVQGDKVVAVEQLLITEEMIAGAEADAEVSALLAAEGARLAELVAEAAVEEAVEEAEEPVVEEAEVVVEEEVAEAVTFRIVGTDGLLGLAAATYQGGLGLDEVSAIVNIAEAGAPTLVLDAGTSAVAVPDLGLTLEDGEALAKVIAAIGYDAMTPGVADLQFGAELVNMLGAASGMSVVSANAAEFADTAIVEVGGVKVGIFGLTTPLANNVGVAVSPVIGDMLAAAEAAVVKLKAAGADFVVALTNMGYEQAMISSADLDWAAEYMSGYVDLIIDGMGSVPYSEIRGTTMYVQLGGYAGALEVTVQGDKVVAVEQLLITEEMIAGAEADAEVSALLAAEGARLAELVAEAAVEEAVEEAEEPVVEEAEVVVEEEVAEAVTFRIVGTDGLLGLAAATYQGGLGLDEVSAIVNIAEAGAPTLILDAGTSAVAVPDLGLTLEDGEALAKVIAAIGYDAMTPGVADLQFGAELVNMLGAASGMSVVSANAAEFADTAIVEVGGVKVGIFGLTTPLANNVGVAVSTSLGDLIAAAQNAAVSLKAQGADFVVALTNMGYEQAMISSADLDWAAEYMSGYVDLIIDGMGSVPYSEIRGTTMYVQLGGYAGALEVTVQGDKVVAVEQLLITEEMIAGAEADAEVSALLAAEGARLAELVAEAAVEEAVEEAEEPVVEEAEVVVEEEVAEAVTFRIVGTDGLLGLAAATYQGGLGLDEVSAIVNIAEAGAPTLVLDAGTSAVAVPDLGLTLEDGEALAKVIAAIGYDAMTPGVADLQFGAELVNMLGAASGMSVVSANAAEFADTAIVEVGGVKVGIFGLTTPLANNVGVAVSTSLGDLIAAAQNAAVSLKAQGADFVVALTNMGYEQAMISSADLDWAAEYMSGYVDLIIDGMGSVPYSEIRGTTMYVQLGGYTGALEVTVQGDKVVAVEQLLITEEMIAGAEADAEVSALLAAEGARLAELVAEAAVEEAEAEEVAEVEEEAPVEEAEVVVEEEVAVDPYYEVKAEGSAESFTLTIVHTNDTHGRLEEDKYAGMGFAKIATVIDYVNSVSDTTLILDAGDTFHGSNAVTLSEGASVANLMNGTYDAIAPGNHDFNYGVDRLIELDEMTDFPFLSANVTMGGELVFQPYKIFEYYGFKVAVVGLTTPETAYKTHPDNVAGVSFDQAPSWATEGKETNLAETAALMQAGVDLLKQEADMVVVLAHVGMDKDSEITSKLIVENIDGIDLFIDGHSHEALPEGLVVNDTVIVQTGEYGKNIGIVNVEVNMNKVAAITPFLYTKEEAAEIEPNTDVEAYIEAVNAEVEEFTMQEIATLPYSLDGEREHVRRRPTNLSKILTTAMMEATGADAALTNGGGIRASIDAGNVTIDEVITVLPFNNSVVVIEVTGAELLAAIENGIKDLPNLSGAYPQMAGIEAIWNRFNEPGERLFKVKVGGKVVDPEATYRLATNDFLAAGGDQYSMFADKPLLEEYGLLAEIFGYYLVENFPLEY